MSNCSKSEAADCEAGARGGRSARLPNPRAVDSAMFLKPRMVRAALACRCRPPKKPAAGSAASGRCCAAQTTRATATSTKPTCAIATFFMLVMRPCKIGTKSSWLGKKKITFSNSLATKKNLMIKRDAFLHSS